MSDETMPQEDNAWGDWGGSGGAVQIGPYVQVTPVQLVNTPVAQPYRENHPFTLSLTADGKAPMLVVRAESAVELSNLLTQVEMSGLWANVGNHINTMRAHGTVGAGLGPVTVVPQAPMPPASGPGPMPSYPAAPAPAAGGWGGAPAAPAGAPQGWFVVDIPFASKAAGDAVKNQLKASGMYQGNVKWDGTAKKWYVSPNVVAYFQQFGPRPA